MANVLFGPAGNSESFYAEGHKGTIETPKWLKEKNLDLFEYSFGRGYTMKTEMAQKLGEEFKKFGIELSLHAPYFINFANPDEEMFQKTIGYIKTGIKFLHAFGAKRLIFHPASCGKASREDAVRLMNERIAALMPEFEAEMAEGMFLCPETMGKTMQIGTYKEIIDLCTCSDKLMPTFDFGHINALTQGTLKTKEDYQRIFDYSFEKLGQYRTKNAHIHFSKIEYGGKGEIRHLTFDDKIYGPEFEPLCECLIENGMDCHVICESNGTMAEDAIAMKNLFFKRS